MSAAEQEQALRLFLDADWDSNLLKLLAYARWKARAKFWKSPEEMPEGSELMDVVQNAVSKTLAYLRTGETGKGFRSTWDPKTSLVDYLQGVISSDLSDLVTRKEHRARDFGKTPDEENVQAFAIDFNSPENIVVTEEEQQYHDEMLEELMNRCQNNDEEVCVLLAIDEMRTTEEKITNMAIGSKVGMTAEQVRNARRRIKRTAEEVRRYFEERSKK